MASTLLLAGRTVDAHAVRGAATRAMAETGLHLATLWPDDFPAPDDHPADPELAAAVELGASWTREAAVDRALELAHELAASRD
jgi:hypothetical protein